MPRLSGRTLAATTVASLVIAGLALVTLVQLVSLRCFDLIGDVVCDVRTEEPVVALTFTGGPSQAGVDAALAALAAHNAKATFFLRGKALEGNLAQARRLAQAGHEIGSAGYQRRVLVNLPQAEYRAEIDQTDALLKEAGVEHTSLFRAPLGEKSVGLLWELYKTGHALILYDVSDTGQQLAPPESYARSIVARAEPGSVISLQVMGAQDANARAALPLVLSGLREKGLQVVTVSELRSLD